MSITKSVVLSCAGVGSRLGLGQTKALVKVHGKTILQWNIELLQDVEDLRIVVGYQASGVVEEALRFREDIIFVYNHDYFGTQTGTSFLLGAQKANQFVLQWDGDLLVHPEDVAIILAQDRPFAAYSDKCSEDAVFLSLDENGNVCSFSREGGDYEWTGPCGIFGKDLPSEIPNDWAVFNILEPLLPLKGVKIRAQDIDVYNDFKNAEKFVKSWG